MGDAAREEYLSRYTGNRNYTDLIAIYEKAIATAGFHGLREAEPATTPRPGRKAR
jgi:hypothetical protein